MCLSGCTCVHKFQYMYIKYVLNTYWLVCICTVFQFSCCTVFSCQTLLNSVYHMALSKLKLCLMWSLFESKGGQYQSFPMVSGWCIVESPPGITQERDNVLILTYCINLTHVQYVLYWVHSCNMYTYCTVIGMYM